MKRGKVNRWWFSTEKLFYSLSSLQHLILTTFFFLTVRFWASMHDRGRLSWMQWCVMGCHPRMLSPTSGWSETSEGSLRKNLSESQHDIFLLDWTFICNKNSLWDRESSQVIYQVLKASLFFTFREFPKQIYNFSVFAFWIT